ncbi:hypothetical protein AAKU55_000893 [Oxalobacteraceae bacterium GrIS 1.11]
MKNKSKTFLLPGISIVATMVSAAWGGRRRNTGAKSGTSLSNQAARPLQVGMNRQEIVSRKNLRVGGFAQMSTAFVLTLASTMAQASPYAWWSSATTKIFDGYSIDFQPQVDSGPASNVYWASQYWMADGVAAYFGMQTPRNGGKGTILWSVWGALDFKADGSPGTHCYPFQEGSPGRKCDVQLDWKAGLTYHFNLQYLGSNWYRNTVTEVETGRQINLGSIKVATPGVTSGVNWTEYFDWNDSHYNWDGAPNGSMRWSNVTISSGEVLTLSPDAADATEKFTLSADKKALTMETHVGRSQELPLLNRGDHNCLGLVSGEMKSVTCPRPLDNTPPDRNQTWTFTNATDGGFSQIHAYNACLMSDAVGGSVYVTSPCSSKAASPGLESNWINNLQGDGSIRPAAAPSKCLSSGANGMHVLPCSGAMSQKWAQTDYNTKAYWILSDSLAKSGDYLTFKLELSRPTTQISWTKIGVTNTQAPAVSGFWNNRQQVSWDGIHWGVPVVYYNQYLQLPIGTTQMYVRLASKKLAANAPPQQVRLELQEFAGGDFKAMPVAWSAIGRLTP